MWNERLKNKVIKIKTPNHNRRDAIYRVSFLFKI